MLRVMLTIAMVMAPAFGAIGDDQIQEDRYENCVPRSQQRSDAAEGNDGYRIICSNRPGGTQSRCYQRGDGSTFCKAD